MLDIRGLAPGWRLRHTLHVIILLIVLACILQGVLETSMVKLLIGH